MTDCRNLGLNSGGSILGLVLSPKSKALVIGFEDSLTAESLFITLEGLLVFTLLGNKESYTLYVPPELLYAYEPKGLIYGDSYLILDIYEKWALCKSNGISGLSEYCFEI